jgi:uncharacterized protein YehS (DUF1456 family)
MIQTFELGGLTTTRTEVSAWLKKEDAEGYIKISDFQFAAFLNGFINLKRGKKEGEQPAPEKKLTNNIILRKLKIALDMHDDDMLKMLESVEYPISRHELSAFFRKPDNEKYRICHDQIMRNFLNGMQKKYKGDFEDKTEEKSSVKPILKKSDVKKIEIRKSDVKRPDVRKPDVRKPDAKKFEIKKSGTSNSEIKKPIVEESSNFKIIKVKKRRPRIK